MTVNENKQFPINSSGHNCTAYTDPSHITQKTKALAITLSEANSQKLSMVGIKEIYIENLTHCREEDCTGHAIISSCHQRLGNKSNISPKHP